MNYEETLEYIHSVKWQGSKPGLSRTERLLKELGNPEKKLKFVHIAGTNGKGSTAATIASVLRQAGYKTGLYTSPYILRFNERMQVNGEQIPDDVLVEMTERIKPIVEKLPDPPTEFEMITGLAMLYFYEMKCDIVVLEVGLGGELDSTNVIETPEVAVITAIGLDHTRELGNTFAEIAKAKAGIIKEGGNVVAYGENPEADAVIREKCSSVGASLTFADFSKLNIHGFDLDCANFDFGEFKDLRLPLIGTYQPKNAAVAITALLELRKSGYNITDDNIVNGVANVFWPGRFEVLSRDPLIIIDGAHNPHGIKAAAESIKEHLGGRNITLLMGVMADKDVSNMLSTILPLVNTVVTVRPDNPRAMAAEELAEKIREMGTDAVAESSIYNGVAKAIELSENGGAVCALGSLYFSADVRDAVFEYLNK